MGSFKRITESTNLELGMLVREFNSKNEDYDNYNIGENKLSEDSFEVYPEGTDYLDKANLLLYYPRHKMIKNSMEYWED